MAFEEYEPEATKAVADAMSDLDDAMRLYDLGLHAQAMSLMIAQVYLLSYGLLDRSIRRVELRSAGDA